MQIEWLTAGECMAGMHEVVVTNRTTDAIKQALEQKRSLWRVSSTVSETSSYIELLIFTYIIFPISIVVSCEYFTNFKPSNVVYVSSYIAICTHSIRCCVKTSG